MTRIASKATCYCSCHKSVCATRCCDECDVQEHQTLAAKTYIGILIGTPAEQTELPHWTGIDLAAPDKDVTHDGCCYCHICPPCGYCVNLSEEDTDESA